MTDDRRVMGAAFSLRADASIGARDTGGTHPGTAARIC